MKFLAVTVAAGLGLAAAGGLRGLEVSVIDRDQDVPNESVCDLIAGDLPSDCGCTPNGLGGVIECSVTLFNDNISLSADVEPCAQDASVVFEVKDSDIGIDWSKTVSLGTTESFDIPGLTFGVPGYASAAAVLDVTIGGDISEVNIDFALDACASVAGFKVCGSDLTSDLPWTFLTGTYDFSNLCNGALEHGPIKLIKH